MRVFKALGGRGFSPGVGEGDDTEVASGEGALDPVTIGGDKTPRPPRTFFGKDARLLAKAGGSAGLELLGSGTLIEGPDEAAV